MVQKQLFKKIFHQSDTDTNAKAFLNSVLNEHPYFGLAQFYALKITSLSTTDYNEVAAKTNLFFNDSFFLNGQLQVNDSVEYISPKPVEIIFESNKNDNSSIEIDAINKEEIDEAENQQLINDVNSKEHKEESSNELAVASEIKQEIEDNINEPQMLFEPLHASDYFASQGIKLSEDAMANDKLGKQLKSFTAWLKTMKKVHPDKLPTVTATTETAVQTLAEKSNIEEEVVTEAMAEAYVQQDKYVKASEIYSKLSLLNPAKSAYFAAKIDSLKK